MSSRKDSTAKKLRRRYNAIVQSAVSIHDTVGTLNNRVETEKPGNPILQTKTNSKFEGCLRNMADEGKYMRSKDFVINNIEHLHPSTLRKIFRRKGIEPAGIPTSLVRKPPEKYTRMNEYDAMVILKWLIGGCSPERIRDQYPCYSVRQINKVKFDFARLRTEKVPTNTTALLSGMKRRAWY